MIQADDSSQLKMFVYSGKYTISGWFNLILSYFPLIIAEVLYTHRRLQVITNEEKLSVEAFKPLLDILFPFVVIGALSVGLVKDLSLSQNQVLIVVLLGLQFFAKIGYIHKFIISLSSRRRV